MNKRLALFSAIGFTFVLLALLSISFTAQATPQSAVPQAPTANSIRISQAYGGGGNSGAQYKRDFIEVFNAGSTQIDISGWTVQYAAATGTSWSSTALSGTLTPGQYYLIAEAAGTGGTLDLPTPDVTGTIAMGATGFKVALVSTTTLLSGACPITTSTVIDFVGAGTTSSGTPANCYEGSGPGPAPSNTSSVLRVSGGCQDADINATDFITMTPPTPRNTASPTNACTVSLQADLSIKKSGSAAANAGDPITYTINLSNTGTATATLAVLTDTLPAKVSFVTYTTASAVTFTQVSPTQLVWEVGDVLTDTPEISIQVQGVITTNITNGTVVTNTATVATISSESNTSNNTSSFATTVSSSVLPNVEVYVQKNTPAAVVFGGELVTYTIVYGNKGTQTVEATLTDTLPISFTTSDIAYDDSHLTSLDNINTRSWTATLASGDRFTYTLALTVPTSIANNIPITNTIEITATGSGNNPIDDLASASSTVYQIVPISDARAGSNGQLFAVEGRVTYVPGTYNASGWALQDSSGGIAVFYTPVPTVTLGDRVRLVATRGNNRGEEQFGVPVPYFQNLGSGPEVTPLPFTTGQIASGTTEGWLSVITGTISGLGACTSNYQFNADDGSGPAVIFVDLDTTINVCTLGAVNGGPISAIGYSTEFTSTTPPTITYEVKPRRPADVKLLYQVTFVYHDLEDAVAMSEDVQLRGDFNGWGANPITMSHDANYTVFSATITLPTTATQSYKYFVPGLSGNAAWNMLNTGNRSFAPTQNVAVKDDYRNIAIGWANLQSPAAAQIELGQATPGMYGQIWIDNVTNLDANAGRGIAAQLGYGTAANPASWAWSPMTFNTRSTNNSEFVGVFTPTLTGVYSYATRYDPNGGTGNPNAAWTYADLDGIPFSLDQAGVLTVTAPNLAITKTVAVAHTPAHLGDPITYTVVVANSGLADAAGVVITDVLPAGVSGSGLNQTVNITAGQQVQFDLAATVMNDTAFYGQAITNTAYYSHASGSGSSSAVFTIVTAPQLAITKTVTLARTPVRLGDPITYTVVVANSGLADAGGVVITDMLPAGVSGSNLNQTVTISAGQQIQLDLAATVTNDTVFYGKTITNTAYYSHATSSGSSSAVFTIVTAPQLAITKTVTLAHTPVRLGDPITYTVVVANSGLADAAGVVITDVLPVGVSGSNLNQTVTISAGQQVKYDLVAVVTNDNAFYGQTITNTAYYRHATSSGSSSAKFTIVAAPNLSASTKIASPTGAIKPGAFVTYTITLNNSGGANATARITDVIGSYYTVYQVLDFTQGPTGTLTWTGVVTAGQSVTLRFVAQVKSLAQLPVGQTTLANSVAISDGVNAPFNVSTTSAPSVKVYGIALPLIKR